VATITTTAQFYAHFVGRWLICGSGQQDAFGARPADVIGVEYTEPRAVDIPGGGSYLQGDMYYLVEGASGPERGKGFDYQWKYEVEPQDPNGPPSQVNMHPAPNVTRFAHFLYSPCPRQWQLEYYEMRALLVPLD
jgi:hypothetical protein